MGIGSFSPSRREEMEGGGKLPGLVHRGRETISTLWACRVYSRCCDSKVRFETSVTALIKTLSIPPIRNFDGSCKSHVVSCHALLQRTC